MHLKEKAVHPPDQFLNLLFFTTGQSLSYVTGLNPLSHYTVGPFFLHRFFSKYLLENVRSSACPPFSELMWTSAEQSRCEASRCCGARSLVREPRQNPTCRLIRIFKLEEGSLFLVSSYKGYFTVMRAERGFGTL